ncbi:MAG: hypothetical protein E7404_05825 [Ruminococcaceae bacterium]|nr:hypothetical protein [Oscillospiraceae bacterium]
MKARFIYDNNTEKIFDVKTKERNKILVAYIPKDEVGEDVSYIDFLYDHFNAKEGDEGYFISNFGTNGTYLTRFTDRKDTEEKFDFSFVGCYGWNKGKEGEFAIVTGMRCDFGMVVGVKDKNYYVYPRFYIDGDKMYEDIEVELYHLENGSYSDMARLYRDYQITRRGCVPLKERCEKDHRLKKAAEGIEVRIRQGWKPVPSPVEYQTPETEPEMHVACTFDRAGDIVEEFKNQGIDNAEFCLVGWNYGGHDGRFPQLLPVDPRLGGEEKMINLIKKAQNLGFSIVCHDDATAAYTIADCFDEEYLLKNKDMSIYKRPYCWGGGRPHKVCPKRQYEKFEISNQKLIKDFGFEGIHYIDVLTIIDLLKCYDKNHPVNRAETAMYYKKTMELARENFGGIASESGFDFASESIDYIMYATFKIEPDDKTPMCDEIVPFWQIAYHGIILYNPCTFALNYTTKGVKNRLKYFEWGGRPLVCYYANFASNNNWMGLEDFICDTDDQLKDSVSKIKIMSEDYDLLKEERYEFMDSHEKIADGVYVTTYSNGTKVTVDYNNETFKIERK